MLRVSLAFALLSGWLVLLLAGWSLGGAVYLLLVGSLLAFPWRLLAEEGEPETPKSDLPESPDTTPGPL